MERNKKFIIAIEETLVEEFEIIADTAEKAIKIAKEQYTKGNLKLCPGEVQFRRWQLLNPKKT